MKVSFIGRLNVEPLITLTRDNGERLEITYSEAKELKRQLPKKLDSAYYYQARQKAIRG